MRYSKFIVALVIILNVVFTVAVLLIFIRIGTEPTALITAWFSFSTGELGILGLIKIIPEKKEAKPKAVKRTKERVPTRVEYYDGGDES